MGLEAAARKGAFLRGAACGDGAGFPDEGAPDGPRLPLSGNLKEGSCPPENLPLPARIIPGGAFFKLSQKILSGNKGLLLSQQALADNVPFQSRVCGTGLAQNRGRAHQTPPNRHCFCPSCRNGLPTPAGFCGKTSGCVPCDTTPRFGVGCRGVRRGVTAVSFCPLSAQ